MVFVITFFLTKEEVGYYDLVLTALGILVPLASLQLSDAVFRWLLDNPNFSHIQSIFSTSFLLLFICYIILLFIALILSFFYAIEYLWLLVLLVITQSVFTFFRQFIRGLRDSKWYIYSGVIFSFFYILLSITWLFYYEDKIAALLYSYLLATLSVIILLFLKKRLYIYFNYRLFSQKLSRNLISYSVPLLPNSLSWWSISSLSRYLILIYLGVSANGIFAIAYKLPTLLLLFTGIFYLAWQEKAIINYDMENRDEYYSKVYNYYVRFLFSISVIIIIFNKLILKFIVQKNFFEAWKYTPILLLGIIFSSLSSFYGTGYLSSKSTKGAFTSTMLGGIATLVASLILIPKIDLYGASIAITLGYFVTFIVRMIHAKRYFKINNPNHLFFQFAFLYLLISILSYFTDNILMFSISCIVGIGLIVWINYSILQQVWKNRNALFEKLRLYKNN